MSKTFRNRDCREDPKGRRGEKAKQPERRDKRRLDWKNEDLRP